MTHQEYCNIPQAVVQAAYKVALSSTSTSSSPGPMEDTSPSTIEKLDVSKTNTTFDAQPASQFAQVNLSTNSYSKILPNLIRTVDFRRYLIFCCVGQ